MIPVDLPTYKKPTTLEGVERKRLPQRIIAFAPVESFPRITVY